MDVKNIEALREAQQEQLDPYFLPSCIAGLERYVAEGAPFSAACNKEQFNSMTKLLGMQNIDGATVQQYYVHNTRTYAETPSRQPAGELLQGEISPIGLLNYVADQQSVWADYTNDFRATAMIELDDKTTVAIGMEQEEVFTICIDCSHDLSELPSDEYSNIQEYGCEHSEPDVYDSRYWIAVFDTDGRENYPDWHDWQMGFTDIAKVAAQQEAREITAEHAAGIINLSRLRVNDMLLMTAKRTADSVSGHPQRYTRQELEERFSYTAVVREPGVKPRVSVMNTEGQVAEMILIGGGTWTTRQENPVQTQPLAVTISHGILQPGMMVVSGGGSPSSRQRSEFVIDTIEVVPAGSLDTDQAS